MTGDTTIDAFLGGRLTIVQPRHGYRAATDPVLLAAAVPGRSGQRVLELGCGTGVAILCLMARVPGLIAVGLERQADYAALATANAARNGLALEVVTGDLRAMPASLRARDFDHVLMNPPFLVPETASGARDRGRDAAHREVEGGLEAFIDAGLRRLAPRGRLTLIHRAERLADILGALKGRTGGIRVLPVAPRAGRAAGRVIVHATKGARAPLALLPPLVIHAGDAHLRDGNDLTAAAEAILRHGKPLMP